MPVEPKLDTRTSVILDTETLAKFDAAYGPRQRSEKIRELMAAHLDALPERRVLWSYSFHVVCDRIRHRRFSSCGNVCMEYERKDHDGTVDAVTREVTLVRAATATDRDLFDWFLDGTAADVEIVTLDRDKCPLFRWRLVGCKPVKFVAGSWYAGTAAAVSESITVSFVELVRVDEEDSPTS